MLNKLFPWFKEEEEEKKDVRVDKAVDKAKRVEDRIRRLAMVYHAEGIVVREVREVVLK